MTPEMALDIIQEAMEVTALLSAPIMIVAFVLGTIISIIQAATQIQEPTVAFAPKAIAVGLVLVMGGSFILQTAVGFFQTVVAMFQAVVPGAS